MLWLGVCGEGFTAPVILKDVTMDTARCIKDVLPVALK
jgi:hypothetical protein